VVRRRLILLDDRPVELADSWYPPSIADGTALSRPEKIKGGAVTLLAELGHVVHDVHEDVSARRATGAEAELLGVEEGAPLLTLLRVTLDADGVPFEVTDMAMLPEGRALSYQLKVG
jgi:DNA-binding GntR family transcriptional regulator